ncbi:MAG: hypothetical protein JOZ42_11535 [Acetobacteraceae bacterium]|nr:hypothetical protein [Acetobacteraceae bacterium]
MDQYQYRSLDSMVRARLRKWPQRPPGLRVGAMDAWLKCRPSDQERTTVHPYLKLPGTNRLRTLPDGLWLNFSGTKAEPFVDIFAIEACGTITNLLDKRSRFAPSTQSLLAVCPVPWLLAPVGPEDRTPRWEATGVLRAPPIFDFVLPVRDIRVVYGLKKRHYQGFLQSQVFHAHEYFVPMDALTAEDGDKDPLLQAFVARACAAWNFLSLAYAP